MRKEELSRKNLHFTEKAFDKAAGIWYDNMKQVVGG